MATKNLTLSFDNGPDPECTPMVLDLLKERNIKTTFFVCGKGNSLHPALEAGSTEGLRLLDRIIDEGHWVGNHSLSHSVELGTTNNKLLIEQEIGGNEEIIKEYNQHKLFRPYMAGGIISPKIFSQEAVDFLCLNKYTLVLFNVLPKDWENPQTWHLEALEQMENYDWSDIIIHDVSLYNSMPKLEEFLNEVEKREIEIVQDFPPDCMPIVKGNIVGPIDGIVGSGKEDPHPFTKLGVAFINEEKESIIERFSMSEDEFNELRKSGLQLRKEVFGL